MADNKKSFLLYVDLIHTVSKLPDEKAGELFKLILAYVNDQNPDLDSLDLIISIAFEPIRQQLKRDLQKYHNIVERNSKNGSKGGRPSKPKKPTGLIGNPKKPRKADSDNDSDTVSVNDTKELYISKIQEKFYQSLIEFVDDFNKEEIRKFYEYWSEPNKSMTKIKWQLEKTWDTKRRLNRWTKNKFNEKTRSNNQRGFKSDSSQQAAESIVRSLYE